MSVDKEAAKSATKEFLLFLAGAIALLIVIGAWTIVTFYVNFLLGIGIFLSVMLGYVWYLIYLNAKAKR